MVDRSRYFHKVCKNCPVYRPFTASGDTWHMMNRTWLDGTKVGCNLWCFYCVWSGHHFNPVVNSKRYKWYGRGFPVERELMDIPEKGGGFEKSLSPPLIFFRNLFLTITFMGGATWLDLARSIRAAGDLKPIVVMSGIHGTQMGLMVDSAGHWTVGVPGAIVDERHIEDDKAVKKRLFDDYRIMGITVDSAYKDKTKGSVTVLKQRTSTHLRKGKYVIWGWCHSLLSTREYHDLPVPGDTYEFHWPTMWINDIIADDFANWVPTRTVSAPREPLRMRTYSWPKEGSPPQAKHATLADWIRSREPTSGLVAHAPWNYICACDYKTMSASAWAEHQRLGGIHTSNMKPYIYYNPP